MIACVHINSVRMFFFVDTGQCRNIDSDYNCPAKKYIDSGFASLQAAVETAFIRVCVFVQNS